MPPIDCIGSTGLAVFSVLVSVSVVCSISISRPTMLESIIVCSVIFNDLTVLVSYHWSACGIGNRGLPVLMSVIVCSIGSSGLTV